MLDCREQTQELFGFARVGQRDDHVARADCTQVAVQGLNRMQEGGGRACGVERGGHLAGDDAGLADAGDDDVAAVGGAGSKQRQGLLKRWLHGGIEALGELGEGLGFNADELGWGFGLHVPLNATRAGACCRAAGRVRNLGGRLGV